MQDIAEAIGRDRVAAVVDRFYNRIQQHPTLAAPFRIVQDWPQHKEYLAHFWWVSLGGQRYMTYGYRVAEKHAEAGFTPALLVDWLALFETVVQEELPPELAAGWLERAQKIGESLRYMYNFQQNSNGRPGPRLYHLA